MTDIVDETLTETMDETTEDELEGSNVRPVAPEGEAEPTDDDVPEEHHAGVAAAATASQPAQLSKQGALFIARFEGFRGKLYNDPVGHCTIGIGHLVHHGHCNGSEPAEFKQGITFERAYRLLLQDSAARAGAIHRAVHVALNQPQFDALMSWVFNLGTGVLTTSTLVRKLNAGDYASVPSELRKWDKAGSPPHSLPGLTRRRLAEGKLFAHGQYT